MKRILSLVLSLGLAAVALAEPPAGTVAAVEGRAEVLRAGSTEWSPLAAGAAVGAGDHLRTAGAAKLKVLFREDSVLTLAADSELVVTEQMLAPAPVSTFSLLLGTVKAIATKRYAEPEARFEVETPTAVAGVRGTGFIATYDGKADETLVVGLFDQTWVRALADAAGKHVVTLGPHRATRVGRGRLPLAPTLLPDKTLRGLVASTVLAGRRAPASPRGAAGPNALDARNPRQAGERALSTDAVDQPVDLLHRRSGKPPPPPPPVPRR